MLWFTAALAVTPPPLDMGNASFAFEREAMCLPSGLRVLYHHAPSNPTVYWTTLVDVGSTSDPEGQEGLAHLVEHLWFDTTPFRTVTADVYSNATTNPDLTTYYALGPSDQLEPLVRVESARFGVPLRGVTTPIVEREKGIVEAERRWRYENTGVSGYATLPSMFPEGHPYHRPTIGTKESIASLTLEQARRFWAAHVTPDRTTWVVTGPQPVAEFQRLLKDVAADHIWAPAPGASCEPLAAPDVAMPAPPNETRWLEVQEGTVQPHAVVGWLLPPSYGPNLSQQRRATRMLDQVAGWRCSHRPLRHASLVTCRFPLARGPGSASFGEQVQRRLDRVYWTWDSSDRDYQRRLFRGAYADTISEILTDLELVSSEHTDARLWHYTGDLDAGYDQLRRSAPVKVGSDNRDLEAWFDQKRATVTIVRPRGRVAQVARGRSHGAPRSDTAIGDGTVATPDAIEEAFVALDPATIATRTLENGLEVWVLPYRGSPFVRSRLVLRGARETAPNLAVHELFWDLLTTESTVQSMPIYQAPLAIGGDWYDWQHGANTELGIRSVKDRLDGQLYLLRSRLDAARLNHASRAWALESAEESLWSTLDGPRGWAQLHRDRAFFGEADQWTPELLQVARKTKRKELDLWLKQVVRPQDAVLVIVGDVEVNRAISSAMRWLGDWKSRNRAPLQARQGLVADVPASVALFENQIRTDAEVRVSCPLRGPTEPALRWIGNALLQERMRATLRETWGATYAVSTWIERKSEEEGIWHVDVDVPADVVGPSVAAARAALAGFAQGLSDETMALAKLAYARRTRYQMRDPADVTGRLLEVARDGGTPASFGTELERLQALSVADVARTFAACSGHEVVTVVGPAGPALASLEGAGEDVQVVDWPGQKREWLQEHAPERLRK